MRLYRYFYDLEDPFRSFTELDLPTPDDYTAYIKAHGLRCARTYDRQYFARRLRTEERLREAFIRRGGRPVLKHPVCMTLEACDEWFYRRKGCIGSLCINLADFDPHTVSFTYGDSMPALDPAFRKARSYHGQVYTIDDLPRLVEEFGLPQRWNPDERLGYETYIEAQVWSPMPVAMYRPTAHEQGTEAWRAACTRLCRAVAAANPKITGVDGATLWELRRTLDNPVTVQLWRRAAEKLNPALFRDALHGTCHARCCALYMLLMGVEMHLPLSWLEAAVLAGMYHDVGRPQGTELTHGAFAAGMLPGMFPDVDPLRMAAMQTAVHMHCIPGSDFVGVWEIYSALPPDGTCRLLADMLRNADSLDYIRLGIRGYNSRFLTLEAARRLVICAMEANMLQFCCPEEFTRMMTF